MSIDKKNLLSDTIEHFDITQVDARSTIDAMRKMSFSARSLAEGADIFTKMLADPACSIILTIAGSAAAAGCMSVYADLIRYNMVDAVVSTGASIVDMDFFEALGFKHYKGDPQADDAALRASYIDRIYDTYIDEDALQKCDHAILEIANSLSPGPYSSREFIREMGRYLAEGRSKKPHSLVELAYQHDVPIFCPAFTDSSAGFGLVMHQVQRPKNCITLDSIQDFRELTEIKVAAQNTGLFMVGGGVPKNFAQDTVVCAELLGKSVEMHKYAIQITVADVRDGGCSSSTLQEACSWGKVALTDEQMIYSEATLALPLLVSDAFHREAWKARSKKAYANLFPEKV